MESDIFIPSKSYRDVDLIGDGQKIRERGLADDRELPRLHKHLPGRLEPVAERQRRTPEPLRHPGDRRRVRPEAEHADDYDATPATIYEHMLRALDFSAEQVGASAEAVARYERGLALLATQPATPERTAREFALQMALGNALLFAVGWSATARRTRRRWRRWPSSPCARSASPTGDRPGSARPTTACSSSSRRFGPCLSIPDGSGDPRHLFGH